MADPNLPLLQEAVRKLAPFRDEIVFVGGVTLGLFDVPPISQPVITESFSAKLQTMPAETENPGQSRGFLLVPVVS